jgi:hypothetical protein
MKFNSLTYNISLVILGITALYTLVYSGLTGLLICSSVTLIAAAFLDQFEVIVALSVFFAMFYTFFLKRFLRRLEPFSSPNDGSQAIIGRLAKMKDGYNQVPQSLKDPYLEPAGVYDPAVEGFQDVQPQIPKEGESSESSAAPAKRTNEVNPQQVQEVTSAVTSQKKSDKEIASQEMESATNNLFKVGKMPSENTNGPKLDAGSTLMAAMESFKPEQINAMTTDTKQLLETQKSLMGMLNQMRPVLADGKELLQTFSGMFGNSGGAFKL